MATFQVASNLCSVTDSPLDVTKFLLTVSLTQNYHTQWLLYFNLVVPGEHPSGSTPGYLVRMPPGRLLREVVLQLGGNHEDILMTPMKRPSAGLGGTQDPLRTKREIWASVFRLWNKLQIIDYLTHLSVSKSIQTERSFVLETLLKKINTKSPVESSSRWMVSASCLHQRLKVSWGTPPVFAHI